MNFKNKFIVGFLSLLINAFPLFAPGGKISGAQRRLNARTSKTLGSDGPGLPDCKELVSAAYIVAVHPVETFVGMSADEVKDVFYKAFYDQATVGISVKPEPALVSGPRGKSFYRSVRAVVEHIILKGFMGELKAKKSRGEGREKCKFVNVATDPQSNIQSNPRSPLIGYYLNWRNFRRCLYYPTPYTRTINLIEGVFKYIFSDERGLSESYSGLRPMVCDQEINLNGRQGIYYYSVVMAHCFAVILNEFLLYVSVYSLELQDAVLEYSPMLKEVEKSEFRAMFQDGIETAADSIIGSTAIISSLVFPIANTENLELGVRESLTHLYGLLSCFTT